MLLSNLEMGLSGKIAGFTDGGLKHYSRYLSLGLIPGAQVRIVRVAPMGCPLQIKVGSTLLSMRRAEAENVLVEAGQ